jgi:glycosyltransferase involved in cell wall biosynthesis
MSVSILILTLNEESNLPGCLESVRWSDDLVVLDSFSSDGTVDVAKSGGARVLQRTFDDWAAHQNWAMENIEFKHPWVFYLDADERMTEELRGELAAIAEKPDEARVAFFCGRKNFFMGKWIRHAMPPGMIMRFFRPPCIRFERPIHVTPVLQGQHGYLTNHLLHYNFSKGLTEWFDKHNKYSQMEAVEGMKLLKNEAGRQPSVFSRDPYVRRRALKNLSFRMPFRPQLKFCYMYLLNLGFMDGYAGFVYCRLQAMYEAMIVLKMKELQLHDKGLHM